MNTSKSRGTNRRGFQQQYMVEHISVVWSWRSKYSYLMMSYRVGTVCAKNLMCESDKYMDIAF
jgi:hypothetical protein